MKNYKNKDEQIIKYILENRLRLQSVVRYLDSFKIPKGSFEYFQSKAFKEKFLKWEPFQRRNFLVKVVGQGYWEKFQEILEKE